MTPGVVAETDLAGTTKSECIAQNGLERGRRGYIEVLHPGATVAAMWSQRTATTRCSRRRLHGQGTLLHFQVILPEADQNGAIQPAFDQDPSVAQARTTWSRWICHSLPAKRRAATAASPVPSD